MEDVISTAEHKQQSDDHSDKGDDEQGMLLDTGEKYHLYSLIACCCLHQLFPCSYHF